MNGNKSIAKIRVIGVGGGGSNAVDRMVEDEVTSAEFIVVNTDLQSLQNSCAPVKLQIGAELTKGLGAGADPEKGKYAAEESKEEIVKLLKGTDLLFITAGMGGGTGTGAAPVIAGIAKEMGILTVGVVTKPFGFEGKGRMDNAEKGIDSLRKNVDTIVIIPNDKLKDLSKGKTTINDSFKIADQVLREGIQGISDVIAYPMMINLDFADIKRVIEKKGLAHMGVGRFKGADENRTIEALRRAIYSPLLDTTIEGATHLVICIVGSSDLTIDEVTNGCDLVREIVDENAQIIFGVTVNEDLREEVSVTLIATGFDMKFNEKKNVEKSSDYQEGNTYGGSSPMSNSSGYDQVPNNSKGRNTSFANILDDKYNYSNPNNARPSYNNPRPGEAPSNQRPNYGSSRPNDSNSGNNPRESFGGNYGQPSSSQYSSTGNYPGGEPKRSMFNDNVSRPSQSVQRTPQERPSQSGSRYNPEPRRNDSPDPRRNNPNPGSGVPNPRYGGDNDDFMKRFNK